SDTICQRAPGTRKPQRPRSCRRVLSGKGGPGRTLHYPGGAARGGSRAGRPRTRAGAAKRVNLKSSADGRVFLDPAGSCCPHPVRPGPGQPGRGTNGDHKDIMSLAGLHSILHDDPQLRDVVARAGTGSDPAGTDLTDTDLVAPPALRPVLAAALAHGTPGFVL